MGNLVFQATLGGQVNLVGPNTASTFNINVPATAGTMVTTGDTGTVTNTMLASSAYTAPGTIGSGTPNTGAFTTLSASTSLTTPIVQSSSSLLFKTNGTTTAVTIDTAQNVGVGVTPSAWTSIKALQVVNASFGGLGGGNYSAANAYYDGTNWKYITSNYATLYQQSGNSGDGVHKWNVAASGTAGNAISFTQAMTLDASGNLGVGTTTPVSDGSFATFTLKGTSGSEIFLQDSTGTGTYTTSLGYINVNSSGFNLYALGASRPLTFGTNNNERARIDSSGNLLVGTTSALDIGSSSNTGFMSQPSGFTAIIRDGNTGLVVGRQTSNGTAIELRRSGTAVGTISVTTTATAYNTSSDYRLKENVAPMTGALSKVAALKPCTYTWKSDGSVGEGFIAHELQEVVAGCVTGEKDATRIEQYEITPAVPATYDEEGNELTPAVEAVMGEREVPVYQGIDTSFLVATLTAAIQEQQAIITQLQADVEVLKAPK